MPKRVRWVVTDIDGTITDRRGLLDFDAVRELRKLEDGGISVGLVSGRPYPMVLMLGEYLGLTGALIAENGGAGMHAGEAFQIGSRTEAENAATELQKFLPVRPTWDNRWRLTDYAIQRTGDEERLHRLIASLGLSVEVHISSIMLHLSKAGVSKGVGLAGCADLATVSHDEIIVSGDASSDLSLFERFKLSVAPANSCESIASIAGYRAHASFGQGFVEGIQHYRRLGYLP